MTYGYANGILYVIMYIVSLVYIKTLNLRFIRKLNMGRIMSIYGRDIQRNISIFFALFLIFKILDESGDKKYNNYFIGKNNTRKELNLWKKS